MMMMMMMMTDFQTYFTVRISRTFVIILSQKSHHTSNVSLHYLVTCHCLKSNNWRRLLYQVTTMPSWFRQWDKFENRSIFDEVKAYEVKAYKNCASFLGHPVRTYISDSYRQMR